MECASEPEETPGFRFGRFGTGKVTKNPVVTPRPTTMEAVRNRPLPPKVPDAEFTPDPMSSFHVGDRIEHNRFGVGKVLIITGEVPDIKATIAFEKYGEKILLLKYAKIRHV